MGSSQSTPTGPSSNALHLAMDNVRRREGVSGGSVDYCGGGEGKFFGGDEKADASKELREYEASYSSKAKEDTIRRLARALKRAGINVDPEGDLDEIVKQLVKQIPNPRNGTSFAGDAKSQEKVCSVVAGVLNDEYTPGATKPSEMLIDTSLSAEAVCRKVGEHAHSFAMGVNTEFLAVHASVRNALKQVTLLDTVMENLHRKIMDKVEAEGSSELSRNTDSLDAIYNRAQVERRQQELVLKNMLNIQLAPAMKELELAMRDESEQNALVKRLGLKPGTSEFADSLAMAVSGLGTAASVANRVHKALKTVGVSAREYLDSKDFKQFQATLDEKVESGIVKSEDLAAFLNAVETLRSGFGGRTEKKFVAALENTTGGALGDDDQMDEIAGGAEDEYKTAISKNMAKTKAERKVIMSDFAVRMSRHYKEFLGAVKSMGPKLGKEIPLSETTNALRDALSRLNHVHKDGVRIELALIGGYEDVAARERKARFINTLRMVSAACTSVMELEMYRSSSADFARLKASIERIEKTVDYFSDVVAKKFGGDEDEDEEKVGGSIEDYKLPELARSSGTLKKAVNEFTYFYYVAGVRENLARTSKELGSYAENYTNLLGDAVAAKLHKLETIRVSRIEGVKGLAVNDVQGVAAGIASAAIVVGSDEDWLGSDGKRDGDAVKIAVAATNKWINDEYNVKVKFYKVLQAVDLYIKNFTASIANDPDAVRDIKKMLDGTEVIARWFEGETGDKLYKAFEYMNSTAGTNKASPDAADAVLADTDVKRPHYYDKVGNQNVDTFGVPFAGVRPDGTEEDRATKAKKAVKQSLEFFQALKNLMNAFFRIGDKFGGKAIHKQLFMSPTQMHKALVDYMCQSAMSINAGKTSLASGLHGSLAAVPLAVRPYEVYFGTVTQQGVESLRGNYAEEDKYFALMIKSMAAKILTTVGVYDMLERASPIYELTPTRMIVGGAGEDAIPEVLEGAAELYFRLPRLAEFYRSLLHWDGESDGKLLNTEASVMFKIAMLPELEGVFAGFIRLIFQKAVSPQSGDYSETELAEMVREINEIYNHFHSKNAVGSTKAALGAFVAEINRRYGLIKKSDMVEYQRLAKRARHASSDEDLNNTNYSILPDEDFPTADRRAPSDRYMPDGKAAGPKGPTSRMPLSDTAKDMLHEFRKQLDSQFNDVKAKDFGMRNYSAHIEQLRGDIKKENSSAAKLKLAARLIRGVGDAGTNADKSMMFHETVVVGLNMLSAIESMLRRFSNSLDVMDPIKIESAIIDAVYMSAAGGEYDAKGEYKAATATPAANMAAATRAELLGIIAARVKKYAGAGGALGGSLTWFDRYLHRETTPVNGRCGFPGVHNGAAGANDTEYSVLRVESYEEVYTWLMEEQKAAQLSVRVTEQKIATRQMRPSDLVFPDPSSGTDKLTIDKLGDITNPHNDINRIVYAARTASRALVNYDLIMREFMELIFNMTTGSDGLVELQFTRGARKGMQLNFAGLRNLAESIFADVKSNFERFRSALPIEVIDRFERKENKGSIFWIEENLVDGIFRARGDQKDRSLDGIARRANQVLVGLTRKTAVDFAIMGHDRLAGAADAAGAALRALAISAPDGVITGAVATTNLPNGAEGKENRLREWYGASFCNLVFYDASSNLDGKYNSGVNVHSVFNIDNGIDTLVDTKYSTTGVTDGKARNVITGMRTAEMVSALPGVAELLFPESQYVLSDLIRINRGSGSSQGAVPVTGSLVNPIVNAVAGTTGGAYRNGLVQPFRNLYNSNDGLTLHRSLMFSFNQLLARYLQTMTDVAGGKRIYVQLINSLANGTLSQSVSNPQGSSFPDMATQGMHFGVRSDPKPTAITCQSLAFIMQRLIKDVNPNSQVPDHLIATMTDVPLYMKESYRANLPGFIKLFNELAQKAEFIKQFAQKTDTNLTRPNQALIGAAGQVHHVPINVIGTNVAFKSVDTNKKYPPRSLEALQGFTGELDNAKMGSRLFALADAVSGACFTASTAAMEVLKELGDSPVFAQTQEGSIETYKARYGNAPLMPISSALWMLGDVTTHNSALAATAADTAAAGASAAVVGYLDAHGGPADRELLNGEQAGRGYGLYNDTKLFPDKVLGTPEFKFQYATRQLLARDTAVTYEQMPGVRDLLEKYNGSTPARDQIDEKHHLKFTQNLVAALRFVVDARNYKSILSTSRMLPVGEQHLSQSMATMVGGVDGLANYVVAGVVETGSNVFALRGGVTRDVNNAVNGKNDPINLTKVLGVTENSNQADEVTAIVERVGGKTALSIGQTRKIERIHNIIDMNIIPINVHALMRDIPLANLYNYDYTFDQMAAAVFGRRMYDEQEYTALDTNPDAKKSTRHVFLKLLSNPYCEVNMAEYGGDRFVHGSDAFVQRIFRGDNDLGMGRPKFLSDQIFNKPLFGSIYQDGGDFDEAGPSTGIGFARGVDTAHHATVAAELRRRLATAAGDLDALRITIISRANTALDTIDTAGTNIITIMNAAEDYIDNARHAFSVAVHGLNEKWFVDGAMKQARGKYFTPFKTSDYKNYGIGALAMFKSAENLYMDSKNEVELFTTSTSAAGLFKNQQTRDAAKVYFDGIEAKMPNKALIREVLALRELIIRLGGRVTKAAYVVGYYNETSFNKARRDATISDDAILYGRVYSIPSNAPTGAIKAASEKMPRVSMGEKSMRSIIDAIGAGTTPNPLVALLANAARPSGGTTPISLAEYATGVANTLDVIRTEMPDVAPYSTHVRGAVNDAKNNIEGKDVSNSGNITTYLNAIIPIVDAVPASPLNAGTNVIDILNVNVVSTVANSLDHIAHSQAFHTRADARTDHRAYGRGAKLTYLKGNDGVLRNNGSGGEVKQVSLNPAVTKERLESIGKARFDTALVRNMFFITNVVRLVRLKLNRELTKSRNLLVASHFAVSPGVTEYGSDPFGPNEADESRQYNGYTRFDDTDELNRF